MQETYIVNLKHGSVHWRLFFMATAETESEEKWHQALEAIDKIAPDFEDSSEFYKQAIRTMSSFGFQQIMP